MLPPKYVLERTPEEQFKAYEDNDIVKYRWEPMRRNYNMKNYPFGYIQDPDPEILEAVHFELDCLEHAKKLLALRDTNPAYRRFYSLRKLSEWLVQVTGRYISHEGLRTRINDDYERQEKEKREVYKRVQEEYRKEAEYVCADPAKGFTARPS